MYSKYYYYIRLSFGVCEDCIFPAGHISNSCKGVHNIIQKSHVMQ